MSAMANGVRLNAVVLAVAREGVTAVTTGGGWIISMFDRESLTAMFEELRDELELEPDWEDIQRDAHLAVAFADSGVLEDRRPDLDTRVLEFIDKHNPG